MKVLHRLVSFLRARGEVGSDAWVVRIRGYHPEHGLLTDMIQPVDKRTKGFKRGHLTFEITEPGYYEYGGFGSYSMASAKLVKLGGTGGFIKVDRDNWREVSRAEVLDHFMRNLSVRRQAQGG